MAVFTRVADFLQKSIAFTCAVGCIYILAISGRNYLIIRKRRLANAAAIEAEKTTDVPSSSQTECFHIQFYRYAIEQQSSLLLKCLRKCVRFIRNLFQSIHQSFLRDEMLYSLILATFITTCCNCIINHNLSVCALFGTALYSTLYVKLDCKRILIGSNLCSIGGNTHR